MKILNKYTLEPLLDLLTCLLIIIPWLAGIILAQPGAKIPACLFPPYSWYLVIEKIMQINNWI